MNCTVGNKAHHIVGTDSSVQVRSGGYHALHTKRRTFHVHWHETLGSHHCALVPKIRVPTLGRDLFPTAQFTTELTNLNAMDNVQIIIMCTTIHYYHEPSHWKNIDPEVKRTKTKKKLMSCKQVFLTPLQIQIPENAQWSRHFLDISITMGTQLFAKDLSTLWIDNYLILWKIV